MLAGSFVLQLDLVRAQPHTNSLSCQLAVPGARERSSYRSRLGAILGSGTRVDSPACRLDASPSLDPDRVGACVHVIAIAARKGGVGKTTLAMHLSVLASEPDRPALLLDTDPQRSLAWWHRLRT